VVRGKKRDNPFRDTALAFLLDHRLKVDTLILAGINTTSCVLCCAFEATNRDYRVIIAEDAVDSMDGEEMHRFALRLMSATVGRVLTNDAIVAAIGKG
jgi:nicotinamidase-related amidase